MRNHLVDKMSWDLR